MSYMTHRATNHPQQVAANGVRDDVDDRATTPELFAKIHARFGFTIDAAAASHNAKLPRFFDRATCGLSQPWAGERVWCNPPYSRIRPWIEKAWASEDAPLIVMILPANRTEQGWWQHLVEPFRDRPGSVLRTEFLPGRIRFLKPGQSRIGPNERSPFGCVLLIWDRHNTTAASPRPHIPNHPGR